MTQVPATRRAVLAGAACLVPGLQARARTTAPAIAAIETQVGGQIGVAALDTGSGKRIEHRAHQRFAMASTFKLMASAAVLKRVDQGKEHLERRVHYTQADLLAYAPVAKQHLQTGMTIAECCAAAIEYSDNTAANILLKSLGGPAGFTRFTRSLGDTVTRLDRTEPTLNTALPGDPRDTTTPAAMLGDMQAVLLGNALNPTSRKMLLDWLIANTTGAARLRAGVPSNWKVGDKTGSGDNGAINDLAILWPPNRAPILVAAYCMGSKAPTATLAGGLAAAGKILVKTMI